MAHVLSSMSTLSNGCPNCRAHLSVVAHPTTTASTKLIFSRHNIPKNSSMSLRLRCLKLPHTINCSNLESDAVIAGENLTVAITLEVWIKHSATQNGFNRIQPCHELSSQLSHYRRLRVLVSTATAVRTQLVWRLTNFIYEKFDTIQNALAGKVKPDNTKINWPYTIKVENNGPNTKRGQSLTK